MEKDFGDPNAARSAAADGKVKESDRLIDQFEKIRSFPGNYSDYHESDAVGRQDLLDLITIAKRRGEPARPIDDVFRDLQIDPLNGVSVFARPAEEDLRNLSVEVRVPVGRAILKLEADAIPPSVKRHLVLPVDL